MKTLEVDLGERSYPIYIGQNLLAQAELFLPYFDSTQVMVITNETIAPLYLEQFLSALSKQQTQAVILPDGEKYKTLEVTNRIFSALLEQRFDRKATLVALGGGVVGDMTGFAAACYQRGIAFIQVPTTLLAQVDSSVGGKTGVNHLLGKNMIGAFYQPRCVLADTETLNTLEDRQLSAGIAEVIKYGLIVDYEFLVWLEQNMEALMARDHQALMFAIERSCMNKATVVAQDEKESGKRALLNLGHTFGHAIETGMGYGELLHGEAIAIGMVMAADLSQRQGWICPADKDRIVQLLQRANLPVEPPKSLSAEKFLELMAVDKKVMAGQLRLVLLQALGQAVVTANFDSVMLKQTLQWHA